MDMQFALGLALTSDKQEEKSKTNVFGHVRACDLHCHLRCPHRHHLVMLWLDLHLETYQHEPAVCPGKHKDTRRHYS